MWCFILKFCFFLVTVSQQWKHIIGITKDWLTDIFECLQFHISWSGMEGMSVFYHFILRLVITFSFCRLREMWPARIRHEWAIALGRCLFLYLCHELKSGPLCMPDIFERIWCSFKWHDLHGMTFKRQLDILGYSCDPVFAGCLMLTADFIFTVFCSFQRSLVYWDCRFKSFISTAGCMCSYDFVHVYICANMTFSNPAN